MNDNIMQKKNTSIFQNSATYTIKKNAIKTHLKATRINKTLQYNIIKHQLKTKSPFQNLAKSQTSAE